MLVRLTIQNYALIDNLELDFINGLSIITGETGAGKSILLGALNLILGNRADSQVLFSKDKKCVVEAVFDLNGFEAAGDFFRNNELDFDRYSIIRREISTDGKSRAFINDTPVNLNTLRLLTTQLVDIHSQRENQALMHSDYRMQVLDAFAGNSSRLAVYKDALALFNQLNNKLELLIQNERQAKANLDYLMFQLNEFESLALTEGEQSVLEQELETLNHAEEIKSNLLQAYSTINNEQGLLSMLSDVTHKLKNISRYNTTFNALYERLNSVMIECKDIATELENAEQEIVFDAGRIEIINDRLSKIYRLQQKHQLQTVEELIALQEKLSAEVQSISSMDESIDLLKKEVVKARNVLMTAANELSKCRSEVVKILENKIQILLKELLMPDAKLKIALSKKSDGEFGENGIDNVEWLFSANKGHDFKNITKVASGGELSRLMLCIKAVMAEVLQLPTMIFDEIDTGVSGEVAIKVGAMMLQIAAKHQVITITHLPQIAGRGQSHYYVFKETVQNKTITKVSQLKDDERIIQIAKMIGGDKPSEAAYNSARELLSH